MKKRSIRMRVFTWLSIQTLLNFFLIGLALLCYDLYEYVEDHNNLPEELEEMMVLSIVMALLLPISLAAAWFVSRRLLRPWNVMMLEAESISDGRLDERIVVVNPDDEIGRLASTLNLTFDRYQHLLDRMQRFNYDASHQLRNPLAAIRTSGEVCLKQVRSDDEYRSVIGGMLEDASRLHRTVDQLLLLARAAGDFEECLEQICLQDLTQDVVQEGNAIGELRGVSVEMKAPSAALQVDAIPDLLREALANLLDNALKFSPDHECITVELLPIDPRLIRITVSDAGIGLTPELKAKIFHPFARGKVSGGESIGLGLAIVADICKAHTARFGVNNNPDGGCCFWIELPVKQTRR